VNLRRLVLSAAAGEAGRRAAPVAATGAAKTFLVRSIDGVPGFPGSREVAAKALQATGDVDAAIRLLIEQHVRLGAAQGFLAHFGGVLALPVTLPANVVGLGALQLRLTAAIAHLRGYDLAQPQVRLAALAAMLTEAEVEKAIAAGELLASPRDLAQGPPITDPAVQERLLATTVRHVVTRVTGKRAALAIVQRVPIVGGGIGGVVDAFQTWQVGRYADAEFVPALSVEAGDAAMIRRS
jgi:hypothetical protein